MKHLKRSLHSRQEVSLRTTRHINTSVPTTHVYLYTVNDLSRRVQVLIRTGQSCSVSGSIIFQFFSNIVVIILRLRHTRKIVIINTKISCNYDSGTKAITGLVVRKNNNKPPTQFCNEPSN